MKKIKNILITIATAFASFFAVYGGFVMYAQDADTDTSTSYIGMVAIAKNEYHVSMNEFFNEKIDHLVEIMDEEDFLTNKKLRDDFFVPDGVDAENYEEKCGETNVSTYCVSMEALDYYIDYVDELDSMRGSAAEYSYGSTLEEALPSITAGSEEIDKEIESASQALEAAVSAYDEFRLAYPIHEKFNELINNFIKYRIAFGKIRQETVKFPLRFIDATSSTCE
jgi:hypothetical protein